MGLISSETLHSITVHKYVHQALYILKLMIFLSNDIENGQCLHVDVYIEHTFGTFMVSFWQLVNLSSDGDQYSNTIKKTTRHSNMYNYDWTERALINVT